jgi:hypothetical protein
MSRFIRPNMSRYNSRMATPYTTTILRPYDFSRYDRPSAMSAHQFSVNNSNSINTLQYPQPNSLSSRNVDRFIQRNDNTFTPQNVIRVMHPNDNSLTSCDDEQPVYTPTEVMRQQQEQPNIHTFIQATRRYPAEQPNIHTFIQATRRYPAELLQRERFVRDMEQSARVSSFGKSINDNPLGHPDLSAGTIPRTSHIMQSRSSVVSPLFQLSNQSRPVRPTLRFSLRNKVMPQHSTQSQEIHRGGYFSIRSNNTRSRLQTPLSSLGPNDIIIHKSVGRKRPASEVDLVTSDVNFHTVWGSGLMDKSTSSDTEISTPMSISATQSSATVTCAAQVLDESVACVIAAQDVSAASSIAAQTSASVTCAAQVLDESVACVIAAQDVSVASSIAAQTSVARDIQVESCILEVQMNTNTPPLRVGHPKRILGKHYTGNDLRSEMSAKEKKWRNKRRGGVKHKRKKQQAREEALRITQNQNTQPIDSTQTECSEVTLAALANTVWEDSAVSLPLTLVRPDSDPLISGNSDKVATADSSSTDFQLLLQSDLVGIEPFRSASNFSIHSDYNTIGDVRLNRFSALGTPEQGGSSEVSLDTALVDLLGCDKSLRTAEDVTSLVNALPAGASNADNRGKSGGEVAEVLGSFLVLPNSLDFPELVKEISLRSITGATVSVWPSATDVVTQILADRKIVANQSEVNRLTDLVHIAHSFIDQSTAFLGIDRPRESSSTSAEAVPHRFQLSQNESETRLVAPSRHLDTVPTDLHSHSQGDETFSDYILRPEEMEMEMVDEIEEMEMEMVDDNVDDTVSNVTEVLGNSEDDQSSFEECEADSSYDHCEDDSNENAK